MQGRTTVELQVIVSVLLKKYDEGIVITSESLVIICDLVVKTISNDVAMVVVLFDTVKVSFIKGLGSIESGAEFAC